MKKPIFIGAVGCGKTTLCQRLLGSALSYKKTQAIEFYRGNQVIDTPGEFLEHRERYSALTITAVDADVVVLLQSAADHRQTFSPNFGSMFPKPKIGIVTKLDAATSQHDIDWASNQLISAGAEKVFYVSAKCNDGVELVSRFLKIAQ
ncbi:EutP/PduV family microcompartment system protein [Lentilactobacillus sp. TOM.63]|uniref:EutP/PduV family microcompartment system protein n=1 Tax=Lentilactobacillus TaxID=2767893 RepID=UPI001C271691|nr:MULTISPECIES: EutP/PduV family microcompartment system protein [Lentilactobacillus]MBU9789858.1 EutP/PduV family microcompartment system protein [Lentilactobacillus dabitei]MDM7516765.1 EutP/PduV family microcompartment system protein [Lentilactobacillus sp. TOM.63]